VEKRIAYRILEGRAEGKRPLGGTIGGKIILKLILEK
jgi:hypothetical protein